MKMVLFSALLGDLRGADVVKAVRGRIAYTTQVTTCTDTAQYHVYLLAEGSLDSQCDAS